nr:hypothetical protein [Tanacetum cinerariifolium]
AAYVTDVGMWVLGTGNAPIACLSLRGCKRVTAPPFHELQANRYNKHRDDLLVAHGMAGLRARVHKSLQDEDQATVTDILKHLGGDFDDDATSGFDDDAASGFDIDADAFLFLVSISKP